MADPTSVTSSDRLSFTVFLAAALHGLLIFGITFSATAPSESAPSVSVTLATHKSREAPEDADFVAQENQLGSGTLEEEKEITTDRLAPFNSQQIQETQVTNQTRASKESAREVAVVTSSESERRVSSKQNTDRQQDRQEGKNNKDTQRIAANIASLTAKLDAQKQRYAKRPRERVLTSVSTKRSADAAYLNAWARKVESVGNSNFPEAAIRQRITGSLRLQTVINWNGRLLDASILSSSGHSILDSAALKIVRQAAPFAPLPPEIRKEAEQIVIIRTWHFDINGLKTRQ